MMPPTLNDVYRVKPSRPLNFLKLSWALFSLSIAVRMLGYSTSRTPELLPIFLAQSTVTL